MRGKLVSGMLFGGAFLFGIATPMEATATLYFACESGFTLEVTKTRDAAHCIKTGRWRYYSGDAWPNCPEKWDDSRGILVWDGEYAVDKIEKTDLCVTGDGYLPVEWLPVICEPGSGYQVEVVANKDHCRISVQPVIVPPSVEVDRLP